MGLISNGTTIFDAGAMAVGGSMVHIKTLTASSSATLSFVNGSSGVILDARYPEYLFLFKDIHAGTNDGDFSVLFSVNTGSSYGVAVTSTFFRVYNNEGATDTSGPVYLASKDQSNGTARQPLTQGQGADNDQASVGYMHLFNPGSTTFAKNFFARTNVQEGSDYTQDEFTSGYVNTTSAIDAVRFEMHSGNIDSGTVSLYGII